MDHERDVLGMTRADKAWTYVLLGGGGMLLLLVAPFLARWLAGVPFVPFQGPLDWVASFDSPLAWVVRPLLGLAAGLVWAVLVVEDEHRLEVGDDEIVVRHGRDARRLARELVVGVHRDGKRITIDGREGRVLFAQDVDAPRDRVREAFVGRGWPYESL